MDSHERDQGDGEYHGGDNVIVSGRPKTKHCGGDWDGNEQSPGGELHIHDHQL